MKKRFVLAITITFLLMASIVGVANIAFGRDITIIWDANTETDLAGYRLYETFVSGQYTFGDGFQVETIQAGIETVTITIPDEDADFLYWVLTVFGIVRAESGPSNEVYLNMLVEDTTVPPSGGDSGDGCFINSLTIKQEEVLK